MIAVAIVAILVWTGLNLELLERRASFQRRAEFHARMEQLCRESAAGEIQDAVRLEETGQNAATFRQLGSRSTAKADYHAAMKQKYEQAVSQRSLFVDPDPPPPPWP